MKKTNIEDSIKGAINQAPTIDFEKLANMPFVKMSQHDYITRQQEIQIPRYLKPLSAAFACLILILACFSGWFIQYRTPDSVISLDINPSIEIVTNKHNQILSVKALNKDAQEILDDQVFNKTDLNGSVAALIASIVNHGYLNADKNVIMVSVENKNTNRADELAASLSQIIRSSASSHNISPEIVRQVFTSDSKISAMAEQYGVSTGKIKLINEMLSAKATLSREELVHMSLKDLLSISKKNSIDLNNIIKFEEDDKEQNYSSPSDNENDEDLSNQPDIGESNKNTIDKSDDDKDDTRSNRIDGDSDYIKSANPSAEENDNKKASGLTDSQDNDENLSKQNDNDNDDDDKELDSTGNTKRSSDSKNAKRSGADTSSSDGSIRPSSVRGTDSESSSDSDEKDTDSDRND